ncbi:monocarboxylate transporter 12 isoform X1 [Pieris rapae]|uniref:monocarboxylate transporter 12 isoform X1 n=2 Tax=Pieris rapae TaxID=64459 RepID=UPI001E27C64D|nr:monocarboxylate transporter 12 isoform X1 [Pieris rapae]
MESKNTRVENKHMSDKDTWGYVVCFGTIITFIAGLGHINSFGLIFKDFIEETNSSAKSLTTAHGVFAIMLAIGGLLLNVLYKKYPMRYGGFIGAILFIVGASSTIFIKDSKQLSLTFGVLQGIGFGMMVSVCYSTLNYYFVTKRTTVMSSIKALQGVIIMWYPQLLKIIIYAYGFRGTLLIIAGVSLHMIPGMLTMVTETESSKNKKLAKNTDLEISNKVETEDLLVKSDKDAMETMNKFNQVICEILNVLNVKVLKDLVYCNICLGQSFVNFSDLTFFIFQPMLLFQYGFDKGDVATCISIGAGADVTARFALALFSGIYPVNTRSLYYVATVFTFVARIVVLQVTQFVWVAIITGILGVLRAFLHVSSPLVISNHVSRQDFPGAYALFMLTAGTINLLLSPFVGALKDYYNSYIPSFIALCLCCIPCLILWPLEYIFLKNIVNED